MKRLFLLDLDGVIVDSKENMRVSWETAREKFKLNISFEEYFKHIGKKFFTILQDLNVEKPLRKKIEEVYFKTSSENEDLICLYKDMFDVLNNLKQNNIKLGVVTSKPKQNAESLIQKFDLPIDLVCSPVSFLRGKPAPDQLLYSIAMLNVNPSEAVYVGDMNVDCIAAKNAEIDYIQVLYGYGTSDSKYYVKTPNDILNVFSNFNTSKI